MLSNNVKDYILDGINQNENIRSRNINNISPTNIGKTWDFSKNLKTNELILEYNKNNSEDLIIDKNTE